MTLEPRKLNPLTSLRFIAATMIFFHHVGANFGFPADLRWKFAFFNGVTFFFVLSGFILTYVYSSRPAMDKGAFLAARVARLWPGHVAALLLLWLLAPEIAADKFSVPKLIANLAMVQSWIPSLEYNYSFVAASWSISTEFFFYLCFIFLIRNWSVTWPAKLACAFGLLCGMLVIVSYVTQAWPREPDLRASLLNIFPPSRLFQFVLGMATARLWLKHGPGARTGRLAATAMECAALGLLVWVMFHVREWSAPVGAMKFIGSAAYGWCINGGLTMVPFALVIYSMAMQRGCLSALLSFSFPVLLGELSYAFYLLHQTLLAAYGKNREAFACVPAWIQFACFFVSIWALAYLIWGGVEKPCRRYIVSLWPGPSYAVAAEAPASMIDPAGLPIKPVHPGIVSPSRAGFMLAGGIVLAVFSAAIYLVKFHPHGQG